MIETLLGNLTTVIVSVLSFLVMLPLIVFIHELGHFQTGRLFGIKIDAFSIGFGPALKSWVDRHGTVWKIAAIPLGGYVKFFGDANAASTSTNDGRAGTTQFTSLKDELDAVLSDEEKRVCFHFRPVWQRAAVVAAGPMANFVLAIVLLAGLLMAFGRLSFEPVVGDVAPDTAAAEGGFEAGDRILKLNGARVRSFEDMSARVKLSSGEELTFTIERSGDELELVAIPRRVSQVDGFGNEIQAGQLGVRSDPNAVQRQRFGPGEAVVEGTREVGRIISITARYFGRLVTLREDPSQIGGPVRIAQFAGQAARSGFQPAEDVTIWDRLITSGSNFLQVAALISISVGFLNLLPVPVLDGGHLMFYGYEAVAGQPMNEKVQAGLFRLGFALVGTLIIVVVINDVLRLFSS